MLVRPLPGANKDNLLATLRRVGTDAGNLRSGGHTNQELHNKYSRWVNDAARSLRHLIGGEDIERLLLTHRYWTLQALGGGEVLVGTRLLLDTEIEERTSALDDCVNEVQREMGRWSGGGRFVVGDTTLYCDHEQKLEDLDISKIVGAKNNQSVHLLFPIAVVDELDRLKRSKDKRLRWRAGYTLAVLDRVLEHPSEHAILRQADKEAGRGEITVEMVFDPPDHRRLSITDDEIIDRALAIQALAVSDLTLVTFDTSQSTRAREHGLNVVKLDQPRSEEEPDWSAKQ